MFGVVLDGRVARFLRVATLLGSPPLLAYAYSLLGASLWYGIILAYAPTIGAYVGVISRPVLDAAAGRADPRYEFSGNGLIIGATVPFLIALAFAPHNLDRTALLAPFLASVTLYYAIGKFGCLCIGCCRAIVAPRLPLPTIEALCSLGLSAAALGTLREGVALRLLTIAAVFAAFLALRIFSRYARGDRVRDALLQPDSIALGTLAVVTVTAAAFSG